MTLTSQIDAPIQNIPWGEPHLEKLKINLSMISFIHPLKKATLMTWGFNRQAKQWNKYRTSAA